ncbi:probable carbohydrate esterase At4g34215 [Impatiens glandulifera]|uniref:probable carbohydrate esterase At4g34215 n=1 Tax=Impatiens glandulifera TaxID=253017 RepID=UPI001FB0EE06|nr:probable carbohydrate esterase At4g34215 [Impatiens glandulifera]
MGISISSPKKKQIFILSGQSNMSGRGGVTKNNHWDHIIPPECSPDPTHIFRLNSHLKWEIAQPPLHADIDTKKTCGIGPGMSFANSISNSDTIGLVPCAVGGTAIKEWSRGSRLYQNMIKRAKFAAKEGEIKALIWYQGESDTSKLHDAECYGSKMKKLIENVRLDLGSPSLPVIHVAIATGGYDKYIEIVREAQKGLDLMNVVCVDAKGLPVKEDNLHLTTEGQVKLGLMLGQAYLKNFDSFNEGPNIPPSLCCSLFKCF